MKYTDEQLSRILSAAAVGELAAHGDRGAGLPGLPCCIEQAANASAGPFGRPDVESDEAKETRMNRVMWFDQAPLNRSDPDAMLRALEEKGWA